MPVWVSDATGRFITRPKYSADELNVICESVIRDIQRRRHGYVEDPVSEDDLTVLLESLGADLELDADFPGEPGWTLGTADFSPTRPLVRIAKCLSKDEKNINKYRSTLAHETGHILTLTEAYQREGNVVSGKSARRYSCNPDIKVHHSQHDWAEWQADQCIGALLLPLASLERVAGPRPSTPHSSGWSDAQALIADVAELFKTSHDAARVRLYRLGYLRDGQIRLPFRPSLKYSFDAASSEEKITKVPRTGSPPPPDVTANASDGGGRSLYPVDKAKQLILPFVQKCDEAAEVDTKSDD